MRILHIANRVSDAGNGITNVMVDLACGQSDAGHAVAVCSGGGDFTPLLEAHGVTSFEIPLRRTPTGVLASRARLAQVVRTFKPTVVHAHTVTGALLAKGVGHEGGTPLVTHVHNEFQRSAVLMGIGDRVIAVSEAVASSMRCRRVPAGRLVVVPNGPLDTPRRSAHRSAGRAVRLRGRPVVTVAGMYRRKGVQHLIAAFEQVAGDASDVHLHLVGDGPDRQRFERAARASAHAERIHFEGFQRDPTPYMNAAEIFVLASLKESSGLVLLEARAAGCAIVATDVDGIPETLDHGRAGLLVPPGDPDRLADGLRLVLSNGAEAERLRAAAVQGLAAFSVARVLRDVDAVYSEAIASSRRRPAHSRGRAWV